MINDVLNFNYQTGLHEVPLSLEDGARIITEEASELLDAVENRDRVQIVDALVDIVFATISTAERWGVDMTEAWDEVYRSNMSKVGAPIVNGKLQKGELFHAPDFTSIANRMAL